jgi:hypothetical protein
MTDKPTRRVRANGDPPPDIKYADLMPEEEPDTTGDIVDFLFALVIIICSIVVLMYAFVRWL